MAEALINGQAYDYSQVVINILGVNLAGVTAINYVTEQPKTNNFGTGTNVVSRGKGAKDSTGSLEISMNDVQALRSVVPSGDLLDIPAFDIVVSYLHPTGFVSHTLKNVEFTNDGVEGTQGDTDLTRTFDLVISEVKYV